MSPQNMLNAILSPKGEKVISETENTLIVATTINMKFPSGSQQSDSRQLRVRQVNLLPKNKSSDYISLDEASRISNMSHRQLSKLAKSGRLNSITVDGRILILRQSLDEYIRN